MVNTSAINRTSQDLKCSPFEDAQDVPRHNFGQLITRFPSSLLSIHQKECDVLIGGHTYLALVIHMLVRWRLELVKMKWNIGEKTYSVHMDECAYGFQSVVNSS